MRSVQTSPVVRSRPSPSPVQRAARTRGRYGELRVPGDDVDDLDDRHVGPRTMSPAIAVRDRMSLDDVSRQLLESRAAAVAVVDGDGELLGVITRTDLL